MSARNKVELRIAGKDYTIVGTEPEEYIQKVGHYIDKKMTEILRCSSSLSTSLAAVLTAINVADDFFKSRESEQDARKELKRALDELESLKEEKQRLQQENSALAEMNATLKLDLAKREAELGEVRISLDRAERARE